MFAGSVELLGSLMTVNDMAVSARSVKDESSGTEEVDVFQPQLPKQISHPGLFFASPNSSYNIEIFFS